MQANSEKDSVSKDPNGKGETSSSQNGEEASEEMNAEDMEAFKKIMGEIDGEEGADEEPVEKDESGDDSAKGADEDFSAELEKVVKEANAAAGEGTAKAKDDAADDEEDLDDDQQKAFENIMAQIEGEKDESDDDADPEQPETDAADEGEDNPVATSPEGEKPVEPSDEKEKEVPPETKVNQEVAADVADGEDDEGPLEGEQQEAFENIMAQIEGQGATDEEKGQEPDGKKDQATVQAPPAKEEGDPADKPVAQTDAKEAADEIIAEKEDQSQPETSDDDLESSQVEDEPPIKKEKDQDPEVVVTDRKAQEEPEQEAPAEEGDSNGVPEEKRPAPEESKEKKEPKPAAATPKKAAKKSPLKEAGEAKSAKPLPEATKPVSSSRRKRVIVATVAVAGVMVAISMVAFWWPSRQPTMPAPERQASAPASEQQTTATTDVAPTRPTVPPPPEPVEKAPETPEPSNEQARLTQIEEKLLALRAEIQAKQAEIEELRSYYQAGIDAETQNLVTSVSQMDKEDLAYETAIAEPRIRLGLAAIQRRNAYIRKLVKPAAELFDNSEELLYLSRKKQILALLSGKTSDIDIDAFALHCDATIDRYTHGLENLNIDTVSAAPLSMEAIWKQIVAGLPVKAEAKPAPSDKRQVDNAAISREICNGDFSRKHQLTDLSPDTARCLVKWEGKDLFLNELATLTPPTASQLVQWQGDWMGLNGLRELTPETAAHLARWKGKGLSLNGLSRLSPRVVAILSEWQGEQIELVNVKHMAHWENPNTRLFLSEEMIRKRGPKGDAP